MPFSTPTCSRRPRSPRPARRGRSSPPGPKGRFELIASPALLAELADVLARQKFRRYITAALVTEIIKGLSQDAVLVKDPPEPPSISPDPDDDYLIALVRAADADYIVSGHRDLLDLTEPHPPVLTPRQFLDVLQT